MRFARTSALDRLADALRRADATWYGGEIAEWDQLPESEREPWRYMARVAARAVSEEIAAESGPARGGEAAPVRVEGAPYAL